MTHNLPHEQRQFLRGPAESRAFIRLMGRVVQFGGTITYEDHLSGMTSGVQRSINAVDLAYRASVGQPLALVRDRLRPDPEQMIVGVHEIWPIDQRLLEYAWAKGCDERTFAEPFASEVAAAVAALKAARQRSEHAERRPLREFVTEVEMAIFLRWLDETEPSTPAEDWADDYYGFNRLNDRRLLLRIGTPTLAQVFAAELVREGFRAEARGSAIDVHDRSELAG